MGSAFPGVDPFLEGQGVWHDFHQTFVVTWREILMRRLPTNYVARVEERVYLDRGIGDDEGVQRRVPDVLVEQRGEKGSPRETSGAVTLQPRVPKHIIGDPIRDAYIEVVRRGDNSLVAVLELLSPANKTGEGRGEYLVKRDQLLQQRVHLVELDLLLRGPRMPFRESLPAGHFFAMVSRADRRPDCGIYPWTIRDPLPTIPIPLEAPDADVAIDLQHVFTTTFERGPFDQLVRYDEPVGISMADDMRTWVGDRLRSTRS
jgi:hypothetical protein